MEWVLYSFTFLLYNNSWLGLAIYQWNYKILTYISLQKVIKFDWLERSLEMGEIMSDNTFILGFGLERENESERSLDVTDSQKTKEGDHNNSRSARLLDSHQNTTIFNQKNDQMNVASTTRQKAAIIPAEQGQSDSISFAGLGKPVSDAHDSSDEVCFSYFN